MSVEIKLYYEYFIDLKVTKKGWRERERVVGSIAEKEGTTTERRETEKRKRQGVVETKTEWRRGEREREERGGEKGSSREDRERDKERWIV